MDAALTHSMQQTVTVTAALKERPGDSIRPAPLGQVCGSTSALKLRHTQVTFQPVHISKNYGSACLFSRQSTFTSPRTALINTAFLGLVLHTAQC